MSGNVGELVWENDAAKVMGGSYKSPGYDIRVTSSTDYISPNIYTGFRPVVQFD